MNENIISALNEHSKALDKIDKNKISLAAELVKKSLKSGKNIFWCGNGGSACDAMHFAEEFTGRFKKNRKALPVISLTDSSHITCVGNDFGFEYVFQRGVEAYGLEDDVFIGLSTSGNSVNVFKALEQAKLSNLKTICFLGKSGGSLKGLSDLEIIVPGSSTDRIQELHMLLLHIIIENVENKLFPD